MSDYTPTTEAVRAKYARGTRSDGTHAQFVKWQKEFDRWLAAHDAEVLAAAGVVPEPSDFWEYKEVGRGGEYITFRRPKWSAPVGHWEPVPNQSVRGEE